MKAFFNFIKNYKTLFVCVSLFLFTNCFALLDSNHDGVIRNISLHHLIYYMLFIGGFFTIIILSTKSKHPLVKNTSFSVFVFVFLWVFIEFICWGMNKTNLINFRSPSNTLLFVNANVENSVQKPFWGDFSEIFGKWRMPNDSLQKNRCSDNTLLSYKTNNVGARDKNRSVKNTTGKKRIVFLGDSFIEGIMVNIPDRCSDILEKNTGLEHLNFGINGTSPINYYLIYKSLAKKFDHDVVVIGILPANDFEDYSDGDEAGLINFPIYRPYWKNTTQGYELKYSLASINQAYGSLAIYDKPIEIYRTKDSVYQNLSFGKKLEGEFVSNSYILGLVGEMSKKKAMEKFSHTSMFEIFPKDKWGTFSYSLKRLIEEAKGKQVIILTIPTLKDIQLFNIDHKNVLSPHLSSFCKKNKVNYIDLLPQFSSVKNPSELYVECDGHWNEKGEKIAAEFLLKNPTYQKIITF